MQCKTPYCPTIGMSPAPPPGGFPAPPPGGFPAPPSARNKLLCYKQNLFKEHCSLASFHIKFSIFVFFSPFLVVRKMEVDFSHWQPYQT